MSRIWSLIAEFSVSSNLEIYTNPNYTSFALNNYVSDRTHAYLPPLQFLIPHSRVSVVAPGLQGSFNGTKPKNKLTDTCG